MFELDLRSVSFHHNENDDDDYDYYDEDFHV